MLAPALMAITKSPVTLPELLELEEELLLELDEELELLELELLELELLEPEDELLELVDGVFCSVLQASKLASKTLIMSDLSFIVVPFL